MEKKINPDTDQPYLERINVNLLGEEDEDALVLKSYLKDAYNYAAEFCRILGQRNRGAGFLKTLLLKRIGSSIEAGLNTGRRMLNEWNLYVEDLETEEDYRDEKDVATGSDIKNLTEEETNLLRRYVSALESSNILDPKYEKTLSLLKDENWIERGTIIFSQYLDIARWIATSLSNDFSGEKVALYAGGLESGIFQDGKFKREDKEVIKQMVREREIRALVGIDAASEGLNLQTLGTLINIDLP